VSALVASRLGRRIAVLFFGVVVALAQSTGVPGIAAELTPLRPSENGRVLVNASGHPVFLLADTAWSLVLRASREEAEVYLRARKQQGFNAVTFVLFAPGRTELTSGFANHYGALAFAMGQGGPDPSQPIVTPGADPADSRQYDYWDHVDHVVALARRIGVYVIMLPSWGTGIAGSYDGKDAKEIVFTAENARVYGDWLGQRYQDQPHVMWMMGGDRAAVMGEQDHRPAIRALAGAIAGRAPGQLISYHSRKGAPQSAVWFHGDGWLGINSIQEWPDQQLRHIRADRARTPAKPTWIFEGRYEGYWRGNYKAEDWGEWQVRQQAYQTVFAGAFGFTYGHERVFGFGFDRADWKGFLNTPGARSMTHLARLMAGFSASEAMTRIPDQDLIAGDEGKAGRVKSDYIAATRDAAGTKVMFYSAAGRPVKVRLDRLSPGPRFAFWFDPRSGQWVGRRGEEQAASVWFARDIEAGSAAANREFLPPTTGDGADWVLVLSMSERL
jgi:hypothetical protein